MAVKAPLYIVAPSEDELFPPELRNRTQEILAKGKAQFSMQVYSGVGHGFAVSLSFVLSKQLRWKGVWKTKSMPRHHTDIFVQIDTRESGRPTCEVGERTMLQEFCRLV